MKESLMRDKISLTAVRARDGEPKAAACLWETILSSSYLIFYGYTLV